MIIRVLIIFIGLIGLRESLISFLFVFIDLHDKVAIELLSIKKELTEL
ncbi:hypothetical protein KK2020170_15240 [Flavobacterium okayamense]|uniref:Uncharacterized protein n=1 Tax=Flavobacterium okayamense TaxID=2830782 RepID=A0ABN6HWG6_9FLAO|nr:hypothetical protein KK2020170_15240 [Flavobacterium okayamense]